MLLLNSIITPTSKSIIIDEVNKKKIVTKASIKDAQNTMFLFSHTTNDIKVKIDELQEKYYKSKETIQPIIIGVGPNILQVNEFYVYVYPIIYKFSTFLKSLDCCFKLIHVLNLNYSKQSELAWLFIQKYFFSITTINDFKCAKLATTISDFKNFKVNL